MSNPKRKPGSDEPDEFTPGERGLLFGWEWARLTREGDKIDPVAVSAEDPQRIAVSVRDQITAAMRERLDASEDPDAESSFWAGFRDGVRAYLAEIQTGGELMAPAPVNDTATAARAAFYALPDEASPAAG